MPHPPPHSFLLRLWREQADAPLHITLIAVGQPEAHRHFATLDALCAFLRGQVGKETRVNNDWNTTNSTPSERR